MTAPLEVFYGWLAVEPCVLYESIVPHDPLQLHPWLPAEPVLRLLTPVWRLGVDEAILAHRRIVADRPQDSVCILCAEPDLLRGLRKAGVNAILSSHNALLDERIYAPQAQVKKRYDAVYNARMAPWKRHALACELDSLLVIGGSSVPGDDDDYRDWLHTLMPEADFIPPVGEPKLGPEQVATALAAAHVGLCLSAVEGAMYASVEYLLAGLPVVSTVSIGGRSGWFEPWFARIVEAEPQSIARAVDEFVREPPPPEAIRAATIARAREQREAMLEVIDRWFDRHGCPGSYSDVFPARFFNKLGAWRPREELNYHRHSDSSAKPQAMAPTVIPGTVPIHSRKKG